MRRALVVMALGLSVAPGVRAQAPGDQAGPIQLAPPVVRSAPGAPAPPPPAAAEEGAAGAPAQPPNRAPPWVAGQVANGAAAGCQLRKQSGGYVFELAASAAAPGRVTFAIRRDDWALTPAGSVPVGFGFDKGESLQSQGTQDAKGITVAFDASTLPAWMHLFTRDLMMTVTPANGAFAAVPISLAGSTEGVTAMQNCVWAQHLPQIPPPFTAVPPPPAATAAAPAAMASSNGANVPGPAAPGAAGGQEQADTGAAAAGAASGAGQRSGCLSVTDDLQRLACYDRQARAAAGGG